VFTAYETIEMEASIMDGKTLDVCALVLHSCRHILASADSAVFMSASYYLLLPSSLQLLIHSFISMSYPRHNASVVQFHSSRQ
jgi:hypothetical protein